MDDPKDSLDRTLHAGMAQLTRGLSPASLMLAWADWAIHLAAQPARSSQVLLVRPWMQAMEAAIAVPQCLPGAGTQTPSASESDRRLTDPSWGAWPFNLLRQAYGAQEQWLHELTEGVPGVDRHHEQIVAFAARQLHAMFSPAICLASASKSSVL